MTLTKLRLDFLFTDLSQHFGIYLVVFALKFFINRHGERGEVIYVVKSNSHNYNPDIKPEIFKLLIRKRLLKDIH